jgi:uncharacterized protein (DUF433 family)
MSVLTKRLFSEIESASESVRAETLDFVLFVKSRLGSGNGACAAEALVRHTPGVCGGDACLGNTRIAVWMLEEARRAGVMDAELLQDYPSLNARDLAAAWTYVDTHPEEIENAIQTNRDAGGELLAPRRRG